MAWSPLVSILILLSTSSIFMPNSGASAAPSCTMDIAFLVDSSGSVSDSNYEREKEFVKLMATFLNIPKQSRGAVITFSTHAYLKIRLTEAKTLKSFKILVENLSQSKGYTYINKALLVAKRRVFPNARPNVMKVALVLTDGKQTKKAGISLAKTSQSLYAMGVRVVTVGIGNDTNRAELLDMVRNPEDALFVASFKSLDKKAQQISQYICNISKPTRYPKFKPFSEQQNNSQLCRENLNPFVRSFIDKIDSLDHKDRQSLKNVTFLLDEFINALKGQSNSIKNNDIMCFVLRLEEFGFKFAEYVLKISSREVHLETANAVFHAQLISKNPTGDYMFPNTNSSQDGVVVLLPKENFKENDAIVVSIFYKNLHFYLKEMPLNRTQKKLGTKILSLNVKPKTNPLLKNVTIRFEPQISSDVFKTHPDCVFWDYAKNSDKAASGWSTKGCILTKNEKEMTECKCNHLTHFAVLMQLKEDSISTLNQDILSIITYIGIGISLLGCLLTLILHFAFVNVKAKLSQIHLNLVLSIALGQIVFIFGINATENKIACICVAALIQYFYLVAFCWMLIEGVQLYLRIVKVFNIEHGMPASYMFAWGFPFLVVIATIAAALAGEEGAGGFVHKKFCWLSFSNKLAWTFVGPVLAITLINIILLLNVIREMSKMDKAVVGSTPQLDVVRKTAKACAVLFPLLGVTWLFGVLTMSEVGVAAQYIFTILNSTQGFLIFLFNCVRNSEIRTKVVAKLYCFYHPKSPSSITPSPQDKPVVPPQKKNIITAFFDSSKAVKKIQKGP